MTRRYATKEDFKQNIDMLMDVWAEYKKLYEKEIIKRSGFISVNAINKLIIKAKEIAGSREEHEIAVEGFFDSYVSMMTDVGHSGIVHKSIDMQLSSLKRESLLKW